MPTLLAHVYLSPHLDDAVLSCGGLMHRQARTGERVVVVTVCAGDPPPGALSEFAQELHARWAEGVAPPPLPAQMTAVRRAEDLAALDRLGAEAIHFTVPDAIYRLEPATRRHLYSSEKAIFGDLHASENALTRRTAQRLSDVLRGLPRHRLYAPLTLGHHVDHQFTRQIAEAAGSVHAYYEDYPYAEKADRTRLAEAEVTRVALGREMASQIIALAPADLQAKLNAVAAYASQISTFWRDAAAMEAALREFAARVGGEGLWRLA
jgi:LmbE family N-acetylglucosaminyl deacetylase